MFHLDENFFNSWTGTKKSLQRWEIGFNRAYTFLPVTLQMMFNKKYGNSKVNRAAEKFIREALNYAKLRFIRDNNLPLSIAVQVLMKLKKSVIVAGFDERSMKNFTLESFHEELPQDEEVTFYPRIGKNRTFNYVEMKYFARKITTAPKNDARRLAYMKATGDWHELIKPVEEYHFDMAGENLLCELAFIYEI